MQAFPTEAVCLLAGLIFVVVFAASRIRVENRRRNRYRRKPKN